MNYYEFPRQVQERGFLHHSVQLLVIRRRLGISRKNKLDPFQVTGFCKWAQVADVLIWRLKQPQVFVGTCRGALHCLGSLFKSSLHCLKGRGQRQTLYGPSAAFREHPETWGSKTRQSRPSPPPPFPPFLRFFKVSRTFQKTRLGSFPRLGLVLEATLGGHAWLRLQRHRLQPDAGGLMEPGKGGVPKRSGR